VAAADKLVTQISDGNISVDLNHHLPHFVRLIMLFGQWRNEEQKFIQYVFTLCPHLALHLFGRSR
jgi:nuclear pore complex protein Nup107